VAEERSDDTTGSTIHKQTASRRDESLVAMPSIYLRLDYYFGISTRNREALIAPEWRARLRADLGGTIQGLSGLPEGNHAQ